MIPSPPSSTCSLDSTAMLVRIEVHMDTLCPWCYIQKKSLDEAMKRYQTKYPSMEFEVLYRPFYLYPFLHTSEFPLSLGTGCRRTSS